VWKRSLAVLGLGALLVVAAACDDGATPYVPDAADFERPPYARGIEVGRTYEYSLTTHCAIHQTGIDGTGWRASPPLDDGNGNPPAGWPNPRAIGELEILTRNQAVFTLGDLTATFVRDPTVEPVVCG
jgi:hypothetical protein